MKREEPCIPIFCLHVTKFEDIRLTIPSQSMILAIRQVGNEIGSSDITQLAILALHNVGHDHVDRKSVLDNSNKTIVLINPIYWIF